jgi:hypothetical protein
MTLGVLEHFLWRIILKTACEQGPMMALKNLKGNVISCLKMKAISLLLSF